MRGKDAIRALKKKLRVTTDQALANWLGMTQPSIHNWRAYKNVTPRQFVGLVFRAAKAARRQALTRTLRPIVEFFPISKCKSNRGGQWEVFASRISSGSSNPYCVGLKNELAKAHGVYIFFDSRGRAIYAGKAKLQNLWKEMNLAFNRDRGDVQTVKRVSHPRNRVQYKTSDEKSRQIRNSEVPLHELAHYLSAYEVTGEMVNQLEALLVRSFANDLLNIKMERFGQHDGRKKRKKPR
jgi:hypothetical protein